MFRFLILSIFLIFAKSSANKKELAWYSSDSTGASNHLITQTIQIPTAIDFCQLPVDIGKCSQQLVRYYYDPIVDECKRFTFSGCGGNSNRFMRRAHCRNRCVKRLENKNEQEKTEIEKKHRRTVTSTTTSSPIKIIENAQVQKDATTQKPPITAPIKRMTIFKSEHENGLCRDCDPLFGTCNDGICGCLKGFRSLGKVCIDLNECDNGSICGPNARCVNNVGSYSCECDSGFQVNGICQVGKDACMDEFDINLTEEDCNNGKQEIRYYYDSDSASCKQFFYGGCRTKSRNFFADLQTCDVLCAADQRNFLNSKNNLMELKLDLDESQKVNQFKIDLLSSPSSLVVPEKPLSVDDWPLRPVTVSALSSNFNEKNENEEIEKTKQLIKEITPNHNECNMKFDITLREECLTAEWVERFYWNHEFLDCEPFWYDSSCDPRDSIGKNVFETFEKCQKSCVKREKANAEIIHDKDDFIDKTNEGSGENVTIINDDVTEKSSTSDDFQFFQIENHPKNYLEDDELTTDSIETTTQNNQKNKNEKLENFFKKTEISTSKTTCKIEFDSELRNECIAAEWQELFFWNEQFKECEAFWYDSSCGIPDFENKNLFKTWDLCNNNCNKKSEEQKTTEFSISSTMKPEYSTIKSEPSSTTKKMIGIETEQQIRPKYNPNDPLKIVLNEALNPSKSSILPEKLPPNYEKSFMNFAFKSDQTATTQFDRLKYMVEFKKKLLSLPEGFTTISNEIKVVTTTPMPIVSKIVETAEPEKTIETSTTFEEYLEAEKKKVLETLKEIDRPEDLCDEPLHPKLEEDCKNDQWEIRWFFNSDRGACKSFWYGGCEVESRNFFPDHANCRHVCSHKYSSPNTFVQTIVIPPGDFTTPSAPRKDRLTTSLKLTYPHSENLFPSENMKNIVEVDRSFNRIESIRIEPTKQINLKKHEKVETIVNISSGDQKTDEPSFYNHIDRVLKDIKSGDHQGFDKPEKFVRRVESSSNDFVKYDIHQPDIVTFLNKPGPTMNTQVEVLIDSNYETTKKPSTRSINDPCDDEYDPKWDEDCLGDQWEIRSYFNKETLNCKSFWYGGCHTSSRNIWFDKQTCLTACAHKLPTSNPFEKNYLTTINEVTDKQHETTSNPPSNTAFVASGNRFLSDLNQKLADIKRKHEGKEELEFSKLISHPTTVSADCLENFNETISKPCSDGKTWTNRYYYDKDSRSCRMFWENGCFSTSKNNFDDLETCQWKCEGRHPQPAGKSCLDKFDQKYLEDCRHGEFTNRFYFDHDRKKCVAFHWGGCQSSSQNFFADMGICQDLCESPPRELTQSCLQTFDENYKNSCSNNKPQQYYYFDIPSGICKMFWFGDCKGENENIFSSLESCQWICERKREEKKPALCADQFDSKYTESCGDSQWIEKWYFEHLTGECVSFWWDGCTSSSQNIFPDEISCTSNCKHPGFQISSKLASDESKFQCLEPIEIGSCEETYPAFYYDRSAKKCKPFSYSGCGGNSNRFMTLSQCENLCYAFNHMNDAEIDCYLPMHIGYGKNDENCLPQAGYRFYFDRNFGKCSQMWYLGCGGNTNNFYSYEACQRTCSISSNYKNHEIIERKPRASSEVCFEASGDKGNCAATNSSIQPLIRWTYSSKLKCTQFTYSGCGGNRNRFATENLCKQTCHGLQNSNDPRICSFPPDWGNCNQLRYMWFYNQTKGSCDQFLYGGCDGNPNRFDTFEICQKACEITGTDPCMESLDRGNWCEAMSNRYYFNKRSRQCKGFHYTGCGKSGNNFLTKEGCEQKCEKRFPRSALPGVVLPKKKNKSKSKTSIGYSGVKPKIKSPMIRHINLNGYNQTYFKTEPQWMDYNLCYGYRYNVSGRDTILNVHFCAVLDSTDCISETYQTTEGEEFCNIVRPFLRGQHLYSWYFGIDTKNPKYIPSDKLSGRNQPKNETIAAVLILKANHCYEIC